MIDKFGELRLVGIQYIIFDDPKSVYNHKSLKTFYAPDLINIKSPATTSRLTFAGEYIQHICILKFCGIVDVCGATKLEQLSLLDANRLVLTDYQNFTVRCCNKPGLNDCLG